MAMFRADCWHSRCRANGVSVRIQNGSEWAGSSEEAYVIGFCPHCKGCITAHIVATSARAKSLNSLMQMDHDIDVEDWRITHLWPEKPKPSHPEHIPEGAARAFLQAEETRIMPNQREATAGSYRRALDIATKVKDPTKGRLLYQRIEALANEGKLTADLKAWAHEIRLIGNDGAHDDGKVTADDVEDIRTLTELVLTYLFTLPHKLDIRAANKMIYDDHE